MSDSGESPNLPNLDIITETGQLASSNRKKKKKKQSVEEDGQAMKSKVLSQLHKTRVCKFFELGICSKGLNCDYAHGPGELRTPPDLKKTTLCRAYLTGGCHDPQCGFAHSRAELCATDAFRNSKVCRHWQQGYCGLGALCRYAHDVDGTKEITEEPSPSVESLVPIQYYTVPPLPAMALMSQMLGKAQEIEEGKSYNQLQDDKVKPRTPLTLSEDQIRDIKEIKELKDKEDPGDPGERRSRLSEKKSEFSSAMERRQERLRVQLAYGYQLRQIASNACPNGDQSRYEEVLGAEHSHARGKKLLSL